MSQRGEKQEKPKADLVVQIWRRRKHTKKEAYDYILGRCSSEGPL